MNVKTIKEIFESELEATVDGDRYELGADPKVTVLAETSDEMMPMTRVRVVDFDDAYVAVVTEESTYYLEPGDLLGVKLEGHGHEPEEHRAGFRR